MVEGIPKYDGYILSCERNFYFPFYIIEWVSFQDVDLGFGRGKIQVERRDVIPKEYIDAYQKKKGDCLI